MGWQAAVRFKEAFDIFKPGDHAFFARGMAGLFLVCRGEFRQLVGERVKVKVSHSDLPP
jgi:hypothetical protein